MKRLITVAVATSLLASMSMPVAAQTYTQNQQEYERQLRDYETNRSQYDRDRAEYDRRYGSGSYDRYYGDRPAPQYSPPAYAPAPSYRDDRYNDRNDDRYGRNDRNDPYSRYVSSPCEQRYNNNQNRAGGTVIGALIGGALGAVAAGDSSTTEGAVLGAIVGGVIGNSAAGNSVNASNYDRYAAKCDASGYYYTFDQTSPYREGARNRGRSGRYDSNYYTRQRCRLAVAPADLSGRVEYRYVRVCPDRNNRYRITS